MVDLSNGAGSDIVSRRMFLSGRRASGGGRDPGPAAGGASPPSSPPPRRKPRRPFVSTASGLLSFLGMAAIALAIGWSLAVQRLNAPGPLQAEKTVNLTEPGTAGIVDQLVDEGVVDNRVMMVGALWVEGQRDGVKHGEFAFKGGASLQEVIDTLVSGKPILHAITIPEGLTSEQVVERLQADDMLDGTVAQVPPEGSLMPDTYKFTRGYGREKLIRKMQADQTALVNEVWARRAADLPLHSPYELATLASIVEKETGRPDERPRVASVFVNRLARGMPLQSDPTIVYGLVGGKGTLGRGLTKAEIEGRTPYNTYTIAGLPPGPIANPGKAALEAAANPSRTRNLFFVADGTGGHAFADTFDQHRQNVARWLQVEKDKAAPDVDKAAPAAVPAPAVPAPAAPRPNQRGEGTAADPAVFGSLGGADTSGRRPVALFPMGSLAGTPLPAQPAGAPAVADAATRDLDDLDVEVAGVRTKPGPEIEDGSGLAAVEGGEGPAGSDASFPVPADRLAQQRAQERALGLSAPASSPLPAPRRTAVASAPPELPPVSNEKFGRGKIFDASEGTSLDPLRDKGYDLNSAKTVPTLKSLPPSAALSYAQ